MATELHTRSSTTTRRRWRLELDAEVAQAAPAVTEQRARALTELLSRIPGVEQVTAEPHCAGRFVLVRLALAADELSDAQERACAFVRSCAAAAGLGPVVLVAVRCPR